MSETLGVFDAKARFSELIDRAAAGEEIVITKRGAPVAKIVSTKPGFDREAARRAAEEMRRFREELAARGVRVTQEEIAEWKAEGRR